MNTSKTILIFSGILIGIFFYLGIASAVLCYSDADCLSGYVGNEYCSQNFVFKDYQNSVCINPGEENSYCNNTIVPTQIVNCGQDSYGEWGENYCKGDDSYHSRVVYNKECKVINELLNISGCYSSLDIEESLVEYCDPNCSDGNCIPPAINCSTNSDCNDNNQNTLDTCINPGTADSYCTNTPIAPINCSCDSDCQQGSNENPFCSSNDLYKIFHNPICINPGTADSYCSTTDLNQKIQECGDNYCTDYSNFCKQDDLYKSRTCYNQGCSNNSCFSTNNTEEVLVEECDYKCTNNKCIENPDDDEDDDDDDDEGIGEEDNPYIYDEADLSSYPISNYTQDSIIIKSTADTGKKPSISTNYLWILILFIILIIIVLILIAVFSFMRKK